MPSRRCEAPVITERAGKQLGIALTLPEQREDPGETPTAQAAFQWLQEKTEETGVCFSNGFFGSLPSLDAQLTS